jgi:signal transduction histidine kinase/CheY-like chemotaxis protein
VNFLTRHLRFELRIFLAYLLIGGLWIIFSDKVVDMMVSDPEKITRIQTYKGWFYVLITGVLFYFFLRNHIRKLRKAEHNARESDRLKTVFLQNISHEIRTPMNGIMGYTDLLKQENVTEGEKKEYLRIISESSDLLLNIVNEVLDLSMIEAGTNKVTLSDVSLNSLLDETINHFSKAIKQGVYINKVSGLSTGNDIVRTDATKIRQILHNLISNAIKFADKGYIRFGYLVKENMIEFFVEDSGIGIPVESQEHIFGRFFKDTSQNLKFYDGVGLGLAISKGLVDLLEGRIWLESELGKGSKFSFSIPYVKVEPVAPSGRTSSEKAPDRQRSLEGLTVLIAEDNEPNMKFIITLLSRKGIKILSAYNGQEAIDLFREHPETDLILMDIKMPVMDGYQAAEQIRKIRKDIYIVAQTAYVFNEKEKTMDAGFDDYISKPFTSFQLIESVNRFLERRRR